MTTDLFARRKNIKKLITLISYYRRDEYFQALKKVFHEANGDNLPIYGVVSIRDIDLNFIACGQIKRLCNFKKRYEEWKRNNSRRKLQT